MVERSAVPNFFHSRGRSFWQSDAKWIGLIVFLNLFFFFDTLFLEKTYFLRDVSNFHFPLKKLVTEACTRGEWPLWNPYIQLGQPLLANPNCMAFYPTQLLFHLFPFLRAFNLHFFLHCLVAGIATFYLGRFLSLSPPAAFLAAITYNFCGATLSFLNVFNILPTVAFLPLLPLVLGHLLRRPSVKIFTLSVLLLGAFFLLLEPISTFVVALFLLPFLTFFHFRENRGRLSTLKAFSLLGLAALAGILIAAIQMVPTLELMQHSGRRGGMDFNTVAFWSMHPLNLLESFLPGIWGDYLKLVHPTYWAGSFFDQREPYLLSVYLGVIPLLLSLCSLGGIRRRWPIMLCVCLTVVYVGLALGKHSPLYGWLYHLLLPFRYGRYPVKYMLGAAFLISLLAGFGVDAMAHWRARSKQPHARQAWPLLSLAGFLIVVALACSVFLYTPAMLTPWGWMEIKANELIFAQGAQKIAIPLQVVRGSIQHLWVLTLAALGILGLIAWKRISLPVVQITIGLSLVSDLFVSNFSINPLIPFNFYDPAPVALYLKAHENREGLGRIYRYIDNKKEEHTILGNSDSVAWRSVFNKLTLFQFLAAKDHIQYSVFDAIDRLESLPSQSISLELKQLGTLEEEINLLGSLNVRHILSVKQLPSSLLALERVFEVNSDKPCFLYRLKQPVPRAYWAAMAPGGKEAVQSPGLRSSVPESSGPSTSPESGFGEPLPANQPSIVEYSPARVRIMASTVKSQMLVLCDSFYPGWKVTVDGKDSRMEVVNQAFKGVEVPSGRHEIVFYYDPASFRIGLTISLLTIFALLVLFIFTVLGRPRLLADMVKLPITKREHS
jgi:hypothetical protein